VAFAAAAGVVVVVVDDEVVEEVVAGAFAAPRVPAYKILSAGSRTWLR
jgi:hypothetical protein